MLLVVIWTSAWVACSFSLRARKLKTIKAFYVCACGVRMQFNLIWHAYAHVSLPDPDLIWLFTRKRELGCPNIRMVQ